MNEIQLLLFSTSGCKNKNYWKEAIEFHSSSFKKLTDPVRTNLLNFLLTIIYKDRIDFVDTFYVLSLFIYIYI